MPIRGENGEFKKKITNELEQGENLKFFFRKSSRETVK